MGRGIQGLWGELRSKACISASKVSFLHEIPRHTVTVVSSNPGAYHPKSPSNFSNYQVRILTIPALSFHILVFNINNTGLSADAALKQRGRICLVQISTHGFANRGLHIHG